MRCTNCGWENPANQPYCEKCNSPLSHPDMRGYEAADVYSRRTVNDQISHQAIRPTVCEQPDNRSMCPECGYPLLPDMPTCPNCGHAVQADIPEGREAQQTCPKCNHTNRKEALYCSHCGFSLKKEEKRPARHAFARKTVTPWEIQANAPTCRLAMIPNAPDEETPAPLSFSGEEIILNRDNTEAGNMTITSKEQAVLSYEEGKWYIQDRSEHHTTFVYTTERIELKPGDIIVLGNRRFEFNEE